MDSTYVLQAIRDAFRAHDLAVDYRNGTVLAQDGLRITAESNLIPEQSPSGTLLRVDIVVEAPRLAGVKLIDSFAGLGDSVELPIRMRLESS
jgi:hypothetical protein